MSLKSNYAVVNSHLNYFSFTKRFLGVSPPPPPINRVSESAHGKEPPLSTLTFIGCLHAPDTSWALSPYLTPFTPQDPGEGWGASAARLSFLNRCRAGQFSAGVDIKEECARLCRALDQRFSCRSLCAAAVKRDVRRVSSRLKHLLCQR